MSSSLDEAYGAVERAYGQGDFAAALQAAEALLPQIPAGRSDQLDQRLQLLIGHIQLYGLEQPLQAETAYRAVLGQSRDPAYRQLAEQGLERCHQAEAEPLAEAAAPGDTHGPVDALPATPWLQQLSDPEGALQSLRQHSQETPMASEPEPVAMAVEPVAMAPVAELEPEPQLISPPAEPAPLEPVQVEPMQANPTPAEPDPPAQDLDQGLLLVRLTARPE